MLFSRLKTILHLVAEGEYKPVFGDVWGVNIHELWQVAIALPNCLRISSHCLKKQEKWEKIRSIRKPQPVYIGVCLLSFGWEIRHCCLDYKSITKIITDIIWNWKVAKFLSVHSVSYVCMIKRMIIIYKSFRTRRLLCVYSSWVSVSGISVGARRSWNGYKRFRTRAATRTINWGGKYSYIAVLPDGFLFKSNSNFSICKESCRVQQQYMNIRTPPPTSPN